MLGNIMNMLSTSIGSSILWLDDIFGAIGGVSVLVSSAFLIYTAVRLLLKPFIGYASSDIATRGLKKKQREQNAKRK